VRKVACVAMFFLLIAAGCSQKANSFSLSVGDCYNGDVLGGEFIEVGDVDIVSCSEPHLYEVYSDFELTGSSWPGESTVADRAFQECLSLFQSFVGIGYDYSEWYMAALWPTEDSWKDIDDRVVTCLLTTENDQLTTGSARGTRR